MPIDIPPGEWTAILIGDQWPSSNSLEAMFLGANARRNSASEFERYADFLASINTNGLAAQAGITAEDIRATFRVHEGHARDVASASSTKSESYAAVHRHVSELRGMLREFASEGNDRIETVNNLKIPISEKITAITEIVAEIRGRTFSKVAGCAGEIYSEIQKILSVQGIDIPPRAFAADSGIDSLTGSNTDTNHLREVISTKLGLHDAASDAGLPNKTPAAAGNPSSGSGTPDVGNTGSPSGLAGGGAAAPETNSGLPGGSPTNSSATTSSNTTTQVNDQGLNGGVIATSAPRVSSEVSRGSEGLSAGANTPTAATPTNTNVPTTDHGLQAGAFAPPATTPSGINGVSASQGLAGGGLTNAVSPTGQAPMSTTTQAPSLSTQLPSSLSANSSINAPSGPDAPTIDSPAASTAPTAGNPLTAPHAPTPLNPADLAQNFNAGNQTGAPMSASAEAISSIAASPVHSAPPPLSTPLTDAAAPATPVFETAHAAPTAEAAQVAQAPTEFAQPTVAAPAAAPIAPAIAAPPPISAGPLAMPSATATPPGSLLAYGADLRPAATTIPSPPSIAPATAPGSAPVSPASGASPTGQPAVVRQQPATAAAQASAAAGLTERAFAAAATGAAVGASAAHSAAKERLQRLLAAVARQQPKLKWVIGDLEDGTTALTTDLSGGWVPPGVEIPTGITLLVPGARTGSLESMLGPVTTIAAYQPGQYLPPAKDAEPVAMSIRARDTTAVDDLGWELSQATKWRDGLPRLAHTLAKAVSAKTGHLDSEVQLLRDYLNSISRLVIGKYPDSVNPAQVGNWQLLATIDALINGEKTLANYHFAWFQAQVLTREGRS